MQVTLPVSEFNFSKCHFDLRTQALQDWTNWSMQPGAWDQGNCLMVMRTEDKAWKSRRHAWAAGRNFGAAALRRKPTIWTECNEQVAQKNGRSSESLTGCVARVAQYDSSRSILHGMSLSQNEPLIKAFITWVTTFGRRASLYLHSNFKVPYHIVGDLNVLSTR